MGVVRSPSKIGENVQAQTVQKTSSSDDILDDSDESEEHAKQVTDFLAQLEREEKLEQDAKAKR